MVEKGHREPMTAEAWEKAKKMVRSSYALLTTQRSRALDLARSLCDTGPYFLEQANRGRISYSQIPEGRARKEVSILKKAERARDRAHHRFHNAIKLQGKDDNARRIDVIDTDACLRTFIGEFVYKAHNPAVRNDGGSRERYVHEALCKMHCRWDEPATEEDIQIGKAYLKRLFAGPWVIDRLDQFFPGLYANDPVYNMLTALNDGIIKTYGQGDRKYSDERSRLQQDVHTMMEQLRDRKISRDEYVGLLGGMYLVIEKANELGLGEYTKIDDASDLIEREHVYDALKRSETDTYIEPGCMTPKERGQSKSVLAAKYGELVE